MTNKTKVVVIGGGTGTFTLLSGLRNYDNLEISVVVTMADDGGSNKVLRDEFGLLPTSGIRQSIVALAEDQTILRELFSYRYSQGVGISGMTFGNLFMAALSEIKGSQKASIQETCKLLRVKGRVLPVSFENTSLVARYEDGTEVLGEHYIDLSNPKVAKQRIVELRTIPNITIDKDAKNAIMDADYIILGPGDLYTNTVANLVVKGVKEAIEGSHAKLIFIMNLMARAGETYNYKASDFLDDLSKYLDKRKFSQVLLNSDLDIAPKLLQKYEEEGSRLVEDNLEDIWENAVVYRAAIRSHLKPKIQKGDHVERSMVRHDPKLLAGAINSILAH